MTIHFASVPATYRHIRRVANTSFKFWAKDNIPEAEILKEKTSTEAGLLHMTPSQIRERWANPGTTFGFVRNPFSRIVSGFHWMGQQANKRIQERISIPQKEQPVPLEIDLKILFHYNKGFDYWIKNLPAFDENLNPYGTPMLFFAPHKQTQMFCFDYEIPDMVLKMEDLETDFVLIQDLLKCYVPLYLRNVSEHDDYINYYTGETRKIVTKWVEEDLDNFGYGFG